MNRLGRIAAPVLAASLAVLGLGLAGCSTGSAGTANETPSASDSGQVEFDAAWLDGGRMIGIVTQGSSTCVPVADTTDYKDGVLTVTLAETDAKTACTMDYVPRVTLATVPEGVDPTKDLTVALTGDNLSGETDLPGVADLAGGGQTDYAPSAGWTATQGQFVILTWGSSTCAPVIEDVAATGDAEVTVTYQTPPENQVCTMDMAPRGDVAYVSELKDSSDTQLILTGGEFDNVKVPIYGSN